MDAIVVEVCSCLYSLRDQSRPGGGVFCVLCMVAERMCDRPNRCSMVDAYSLSCNGNERQQKQRQKLRNDWSREGVCVCDL